MSEAQTVPMVVEKVWVCCCGRISFSRAHKRCTNAVLKAGQRVGSGRDGAGGIETRDHHAAWQVSRPMRGGHCRPSASVKGIQFFGQSATSGSK